MNGLFWSGDERIPEHWREEWGHETFFVSIEEWLDGQDYQQLNTFLKKAGVNLMLRSPGQADIEIAHQRWGTVSTGKGDFQAVVFQLRKEQAEVAPGVPYTLHAVGDSEPWWSVREGVALVRERPTPDTD